MDQDNKLGLALSGGGIRSATFSLGILQGPAKRKILTNLSYLSTVSGGGYIGSNLYWRPSLAVETMTALSTATFAQPPVPKIITAKKNGNRIVITGEQFIDLKTCGKELKFEIAPEAAGSAFKAVENLTLVSAKEVSLDLPKTPADGKFKVRVLLGGIEMDMKNVE